MTTSDILPTDVVVTTPAPAVSVRPIVPPAPERGEDLRVGVSAPVTGRGLPPVSPTLTP